MVELSDIEDLLAEVEADKAKGHAEVDAKYQADVAHVMAVKAMLERRKAANNGAHSRVRPIRSSAAPFVDSSNSDTPLLEWPGPRRATRAALPGTGNFTLDDVVRTMKAAYPERKIDRVLVSGELYALKQMGEISTVKKGRGNVPNIYRKEALLHEA